MTTYANLVEVEEEVPEEEVAPRDAAVPVPEDEASETTITRKVIRRIVRRVVKKEDGTEAFVDTVEEVPAEVVTCGVVAVEPTQSEE